MHDSTDDADDDQRKERHAGIEDDAAEAGGNEIGHGFIQSVKRGETWRIARKRSPSRRTRRSWRPARPPLRKAARTFVRHMTLGGSWGYMSGTCESGEQHGGASQR